MIATRNAIKTLITHNYTDFLTVYVGFPLAIRVEDVAVNNARKGGLGTYCKTQDYKWHSSAQNIATLEFGIELYLDATGEGDVNDRGAENEEWLWSRMEGIRDLLFDTDNAVIVADTTIIKAPVKIESGIMEGSIRQLRMTITYDKRVTR